MVVSLMESVETFGCSDAGMDRALVAADALNTSRASYYYIGWSSFDRPRACSACSIVHGNKFLF